VRIQFRAATQRRTYLPKGRDMSAVAPAFEQQEPVEVEPTDMTAFEASAAPTKAQEEEQEMYRWVKWFGGPMLVASLFVAAVFAFDAAWLIGAALFTLIVSIFTLIYLSISSDTNGSAVAPSSAGH
jgi:hypothetical protein